MPINFLDLSKTWRDYPDSRAQRVKVLVRHLAPLLAEDYTIQHGGKKQITDTIKKSIPNVNANDIAYAVTLLRVAYRYLNNVDRDVVQKKLDQKTNATRGLRCMLEDGLDTWEKVQQAAKEHAENVQVQPATPSDIHTEVAEAVFAKEEKPAPPVLQDLFSRLLSDVTELGLALVATNEELQKLLHENAQIYEQVALDNFEKANKQFEREQDHLSSLEKIVAAFPQIPQLYELKEKIKAVVQPVIQKKLVVPEEFPRILFAEGKARMIYRNSFLDDFYSLPRIEQLSVTEALKKLVQYGRSYPSLQCKVLSKEVVPQLDGSLKSTPYGALYCRASTGIRFTWHKEDRDVLFYNVVRRGSVGFTEK